jgi:hypothetical protein
MTDKKLQIRNSTAEFLIFTKQNNKNTIWVRIEDETVWLTQKLMSVLFEKGRSTITGHLQNIFETGELKEISVCRDFRHTAEDGKEYNTKFYNLDAIIAVGFRVNSERATQFRQWTINILRDFAIRGYVLDNERLRNGSFFNKEYFDHLLAEIREIRASERRFYQKITDIYTLAADYDKNAPVTKDFFATVQNKLHWAITGKTWLFNFFRVGVSMTKKINHRGHGGHRELLFSLCPLCALWFFQNPFQNITKSLGKPAAEIIYDSADCDNEIKRIRGEKYG